MSKNNSGGFYFSEELGFEPKTKKKEDKKRGDKKDGKGENKKPKQKD